MDESKYGGMAREPTQLSNAVVFFQGIRDSYETIKKLEEDDRYRFHLGINNIHTIFFQHPDFILQLPDGEGLLNMCGHFAKSIPQGRAFEREKQILEQILRESKFLEEH